MNRNIVHRLSLLYLAMTLSGPVSKREADERIALIRKCSRPWDKKCRCDAHRAYFHNTLD